MIKYEGKKTRKVGVAKLVRALPSSNLEPKRVCFFTTRLSNQEGIQDVFNGMIDNFLERYAYDPIETLFFTDDSGEYGLDNNLQKIGNVFNLFEKLNSCYLDYCVVNEFKIIPSKYYDGLDFVDVDFVETNCKLITCDPGFDVA